jgi:hypothetical protein
MMLMTLFVLFGDSIKILTLPKDAGNVFFTFFKKLFYNFNIVLLDDIDYAFEIANTVCLFAFIFELILSTFSKSVITAEYRGFCDSSKTYDNSDNNSNNNDNNTNTIALTRQKSIATYAISAWCSFNTNYIKNAILSLIPFRLHYYGYIFSFYWICDCAAIVSMFPDIPWIAYG